MEAGEFRAKLMAATPTLTITPVLIGINLIVFVIITCVEGHTELTNEAYLAWGANFQPLTTSGEWWRLFTSAFLHFGLVHLAVNLWVLFDAGRLVERLYGHLPFLLIYCFSAVTGGFGSILWNSDKIISLGASGAIFGVYGALLAYLLTQKRTIPPRLLKVLFASALFFVLFTIAYGIFQRGIDNAAHGGGLIGGFLLGITVSRPLEATGRGQGINIRFVTGAISAVACVLLLAVVAPRPGYDVTKEQLFHADMQWFKVQEASANKNYNELIAKARDGLISGDELADALYTECLTRWDAIYTRISNNALEPKAPSYAIHRLTVKFSKARRDALIVLIEGLRKQDPRRIEQFRELQAEAEKIVDDMKSLSASH